MDLLLRHNYNNGKKEEDIRIHVTECMVCGLQYGKIEEFRGLYYIKYIWIVLAGRCGFEKRYSKYLFQMVWDDSYILKCYLVK